METRHLYTKGYFQASRYFQADPERLKELVGKVLGLKPASVLDVGCGRGFLVEALNNVGISSWGADFAPWAISRKRHSNCLLADAKNLPFKDKEFDLVISTDFFEHIPEDELDDVIGEMRRVGTRCASRIALSTDAGAKENEYHLTVKPKDWWQERFPELIIL